MEALTAFAFNVAISVLFVKCNYYGPLIEFYIARKQIAAANQKYN